MILKLNAIQIKEAIKTKFKKTTNLKTIFSILSNIRKVIGNYLKHKYRSSQIGGLPEYKIIMALDESLFIYDENNNQIWIVKNKGTTSKRFRLDIIKRCNSENLQVFVENHFEAGTKRVTDGWSSYSFLDNANFSVWEHETHNQGAGDFRF